ncbi:ABC transporter permease [Hyphobacterium sp.]|uniref:ABC transporter permease n=1 Tax=Hyphobacterium sp. TaxID=2004662 RepID=UPI003B5190E1
MIGVLRSDFLKLRRSLVLLIVAVSPVMIFLLGVLVMISGNASGEWTTTALSGMAVWAYFLLPMTATGLTALIAQLEHGTNTWSHILTTGVPRWQVFASKALLTIALMAFVSALVWAAIFAAGHLGGALAPANALAGAPPYFAGARLLALMWLASFLVTAIQLAIALRFASFALPVSVGIGGTFVAVAATASRWGLVFPWLLPVNVLATDAARSELAIAIGAIGGLTAFAAMILWLSRKDWS